MEPIISLKRFHVPFDPHDMKYFACESDVLKRLSTAHLPPGVKRVTQHEEDLKLILNNKGEIIGERVTSTKVIYFYTADAFMCGLHKQKGEH